LDEDRGRIFWAAVAGDNLADYIEQYGADTLAEEAP
jgi:hypothetical protein